MIKTTLYSDHSHAWYSFSRDQHKAASVVDTNEYLIINDGEAMALDPGGTEIFPQVLSAFSEVVSVSDIKYFLASHQDPDIISSLPLWMGLAPKAKIYMSWLWSEFIAHFGHQYATQFIGVPDEGMAIQLGSSNQLQLVPAHYCHSPGNFNVYDPIAKILFSGDIGAAMLPSDYTSPFIDDMSAHFGYMQAFHQRWMPSNKAKNDWVKRVRQLDVHMLCPQHGAIFRHEQVGEFLDWFEQLEVGIAVADPQGD